jgi:DNA-binding MarR family transcriptional regulator
MSIGSRLQGEHMTDVDSDRGRRQVAGIRELMMLHQLVPTRLGRALRPLGITVTHVSFLSHLAADGGRSPVSEVAASIEVNQPAVSKTMKALVELGFVVAESQDGDARRRSARLTDAGWDILREAQIAMHPVADNAFEPLTDDALEQLIETLTGIRGRMDAGSRAGSTALVASRSSR